MITLAQARELAGLINDYTAASIKMREFDISMEDYNAAKRAMSNYISRMVDPTEAAIAAMNLGSFKPAADAIAEKKRQRKNFLARQRRAYKK